MQPKKLELREIIWEITGRCENHCEYCGSKEAWNSPIEPDNIIKIAQNIAKYPPKEIDISGGDPLLLPYGLHLKVTDILKKAKIKCKILINLKSIKNNITEIAKILSLYDWVGLSINTLEELKLFNYCFPISKSTIISNFNLQNIFIYSDIENFVKENNLMWQIQFTMYKDVDNPLALYNNEKALYFFSEKVSQSLGDKVKILIADNANCGNCGAGFNSIGILYNGDIVPCLSMRSWADIKDVVVGNILGEDWNKPSVHSEDKIELQYIWEKRFNDYRFESFKCCKDHCKNKCVTIFVKEAKSIFEDELNKLKDKEEKNKHEKICPPPRVMLYGVQPYTYVYACPSDWNNTVSVYAVSTSYTIADIKDSDIENNIK